MMMWSAQLGLATGLSWTVPAALAGLVRKASGESAPSTPRALPSADQVAWQDLELGMFVHFAPNTWQDTESDNLTTPLAEINPRNLDTDQWARTAVDLGAKYIVFVAKHQGGFCMWQTETTDYSIRKTRRFGGHRRLLPQTWSQARRLRLPA
jgi:alpha-L-fucosidase